MASSAGALPYEPKPMTREAADASSVAMLPALPSPGAVRAPAAGAMHPEQRPRSTAHALPAVSTFVTRAAGRQRRPAVPRPAPIVSRRVPGVVAVGGPRVSPTVIATVSPEPQGSRPTVISTTLPPGAPVPQDTNPPQPPNPDVAPAGPSSGAAEGYVLGAGDQIEVNVPHLAAIVTLGPDGMIALPLISPVRAVGKTTAQLASELTGAYAKVLDAPSVTVFVRQYRMKR